MLNKTPMIVRASLGTQTILRATAIGWQGEMGLSTDTGRLWVCPTTESPFVSPVGGSSPPSVTGSRGGNAALASLLTALASLGVILDNTTP